MPPLIWVCVNCFFTSLKAVYDGVISVMFLVSVACKFLFFQLSYSYCFSVYISVITCISFSYSFIVIFHKICISVWNENTVITLVLQFYSIAMKIEKIQLKLNVMFNWQNFVISTTLTVVAFNVNVIYCMTFMLKAPLTYKAVIILDDRW